MKNKLLLTTALVAFAIPALATDGLINLGEGASKVIAEEVAINVNTDKSSVGIDVRGNSEATFSEDVTISVTSSAQEIDDYAYGVFVLNGDVDFRGNVNIETNSDSNSRAVWGWDNAEISFNGNNTKLSSIGEAAMTIAADNNSSIIFNSNAVISANDDNEEHDYSTTSVAATGNGSITFNGASTDISVNAKNNYASAVYADHNGVINFNSDTTNIVAVGSEAYGIEAYAKSIVNIKGNVAVSGSTSDIYNEGTLIVDGSLTLDNGISGDGAITFENGSNLTVQANKTTIANSVTNKGATLNMVFDSGFTGGYQLITGSLDKEFTIAENGLYKITAEEDVKGAYVISKKSSSDIADSLGLSLSDASVLTAAISSEGSSGNTSFDAVSQALNQAAQLGDKEIVKEVAKIGADAAPVVTSQERGSVDMLFNVVSGELNGDTSSLGRSSGDAFKKVTAWVRGLFNKADHETTSKSAGFNADTYGVAFGLDKEVNNNTRLGVGYAYSQTDVETLGRDTDIDTNTLFVYAKYQPAKWYVNSMLGYSWSAYKEAKTVAGYDAGAKYDVDTIALQSMYGYEGNIANHNVTPEFGFRYLRVEKDSYTDRLGTSIASSSEDILTAVLATKIAKDYRADNGVIVRPELRVAVTYDVMEADNIANVVLANGSSYNVYGEKQNRLGFELGAKLTTYAADNFEFSAGAQTNFREDYQDYSFTLDAKYNF